MYVCMYRQTNTPAIPGLDLLPSISSPETEGRHASPSPPPSPKFPLVGNTKPMAGVNCCCERPEILWHGLDNHPLYHLHAYPLSKVKQMGIES